MPWPPPSAPTTPAPMPNGAPTRSAPWKPARTAWRANATAPTAAPATNRHAPRSSTWWPTSPPSRAPTTTPGCTLDPHDLGPADLVAELSTTAKLVPVVHPGDTAAECGYTPSPQLADFVRCRDLTCRFPGCNRAASRCDVDHTIPFGDGGLTQASNLKCLRVSHESVTELRV